jgi:hypothetical protein
VSIAHWIISRVTRRPPDFVIGGTERPYLRRWWVIPRNRFFNVYLHQFVRSDDDRALHDHPFYCGSRILRGRYLEHTLRGVFERKAGDFVFRRGTTLHRVELHDGPCWSLFVTGPRYRTWGFACPQGWRPWREFVDARDSGAVGKGCD